MTHKSRIDRRRVFKLGSQVDHVTRHAQQLFKFKRSKVKVTKSRDVSADKNTITQPLMIGSVRSYQLQTGWWELSTWGSWYTFQVSRSNKPEVEMWRTFKILNVKINVKRRQIAEIFTLIGNRGRRIERRCLNFYLKSINNRFCACAVQMLLTMAANATKCSTFEVQYGKSTLTRTTATTTTTTTV